MRSHTMAALERHRGHFYNWYDTQSLQPLPPLYISSVDSGNLAGHLLTLRPGLLALPDHKILGARLFDGLSDTLRILVDAAGDSRSGHGSLNCRRIWSLRTIPGPPRSRRRGTWLDRLAASAAEVAGSLDAAPRPRRRAKRSGGRRRSPGNAGAPSMS